MKNLHLFNKEIDFESVKNSLELPWVSLVEDINKVFYMYTYKPNPSVYYKIEDNILYIRGTKQEGYSERLLFTDVTAAKNGWYSASNKAQITKAVIEEIISPTSCVRFFDGMSGMTTIENIENLKMDNATDLSAMFQNCNVLTSIGDISDWNVGNVTNMRFMFNGCNALTSVGDLSKWNVANVTNMKVMFQYCYALTSVGDLSNWNVANVTDMSTVFNSCYVLASIGDLSNWNVANVTDMKALFECCYSLTSIGDISGWDVSNVTNMSYMFTDCYTLTSIGNLSKWNVSKVTNMEAMFNSNDPSKPLILKSIGDLSKWDVSNVTDMHYMFRGCTSLNELNLSSWNTSKVTTMYEAFSNFIAWNKYTEFSIPKINIPPIPKDCNTDHAFSFDYSLTTIESSGKISKSLNFQWSPLTHDSAMVLINALDSVNTGTLTLSTATKETLSAEEIAIAENKGWTITAA